MTSSTDLEQNRQAATTTHEVSVADMPSADELMEFGRLACALSADIRPDDAKVTREFRSAPVEIRCGQGVSELALLAYRAWYESQLTTTPATAAPSFEELMEFAAQTDDTTAIIWPPDATVTRYFRDAPVEIGYRETSHYRALAAYTTWITSQKRI